MTSPSITREQHGTRGGEAVARFTLRGPGGLVATVSELGATLLELSIPDRRGAAADVVLGFERLESYLEPGPYLGSVVGRVANRIAGARFTLDGREHELSRNHGRHHLHGGIGGFSRAVWRGEATSSLDAATLLLRYRSRDGEDGYPGTVEASVAYTLGVAERATTAGNAPDRVLGELRIEFSATTDRATIVNLSQHSYWNLAGHDRGDVLDHRLAIAAQYYTPADAELIPTGAIVSVEGGPFDWRRERRIGDAIGELAAGDPAADRAANGGFDVNYVLDGERGTLRRAATLREPSSGRVMEVWTTEPGIQLYTGNQLAAVEGKRGATYGKHAGLCLETQHFPDSIHHQGEPGWPSIVLRPGEVYRYLAVHRFLVE